MKRKFASLILMLVVLTACSPRIDYSATYTAFWENLPSDTPMPSDTPAPDPSETPTLSPSLPLVTTVPPSETPTETPTETSTPTLLLTARLIWPRAKFGPEHVSWRDSSCPYEGNNLSCEFEYRTDSSGCYVGGTCYDACGWYYSVNTIPADVGPEYCSGPCW